MQVHPMNQSMTLDNAANRTVLPTVALSQNSLDNADALIITNLDEKLLLTSTPTKSLLVPL